MNELKARAREKMANALHLYAAWLLDNPNAEPLIRRAQKHIIGDELMDSLLDQAYQKGVEDAEGIIKAQDDKPVCAYGSCRGGTCSHKEVARVNLRFVLSSLTNLKKH